MTNLDKVNEMCRRVNLSRIIGRGIFLKALSYGLRKGIPQDIMMVDVACAIKYAADNRQYLLRRNNTYENY